MNPKLRSFLIVFAKQAIIGASTTIAVVWQDPEKFNLNHVAGLEHVGLTIAAAVGAREAMVWGPRLLAWANSPTPDAE